jgi:cell surface protein SprA
MIDDKGQVVMGTTKVLSPTQVEFTPNKDVDNAKVTVTGKRDVVETQFTKIMDQVVTVLMMTKTLSVNYTQSEGTYIPGYKYGTQNFGLYKPFGPLSTPGWPYVVGIIPSNIDTYLQTTEWLVDNEMISEKYKRTYTNQLRVQTSLEPIKSMRINLNADRSFSKNYTRYLQGNEELNKRNALTNGNFTMSYNTISSAFNSDKAYERFKENRIIIANRLIQKNVGNEYEIDPISGYPVLYKETSQDVLIPAFLAAYSGQKPTDVYLNNYFIPMFSSFKDFARTLNWRFSYNGLAKVKYFKDYFKSININHAYNSNFNLGAYETFTAESMFDDTYFIDRVDGLLYLSPKYNVSNISISERFNPIIGVDAKLVNNMTAKFEIRSNRNVSLSFRNTEISETGGLEYVVGGGYVFKNFKVNINTANGKQSYENDLNIRMDLSIRNNQTIRRNIVEDITRKISGNKMYSLKTYADYMLNERFTIRIYLDYSMNKPLTNGYKTSSLNGGVNLRFSLM